MHWLRNLTWNFLITTVDYYDIEDDEMVDAQVFNV